MGREPFDERDGDLMLRSDEVEAVQFEADASDDDRASLGSVGHYNIGTADIDTPRKKGPFDSSDDPQEDAPGFNRKKSIVKPGKPEGLLEKSNGKRARVNASYHSHQSTAGESEDDGYLSDNNNPLVTPTHHDKQSNTLPLFVAEEENSQLSLEDDLALDESYNNLIDKYSIMDGLQRARNVKAEIENNISVLQPQDKKTSTRRTVEEDPENITIKKLRQDGNQSWKDIADHLNRERRNRGEPATFTEAAVYSRFVRNSSRIATAIGEIGFDPKDYMHLRNLSQYAKNPNAVTIAQTGRKRVKNPKSPKELEKNIRKEFEGGRGNDLKSAEKTEQLMEAVAKVERNFWVLVADEMERATTKMYEPNELASRYHEI